MSRQAKRRCFSDRLRVKAKLAALKAAGCLACALWSVALAAFLLQPLPGAVLPCLVLAAVCGSACRRYTVRSGEHWRRYFEEVALAAEMSRRERWERNFVRSRRVSVSRDRAAQGPPQAPAPGGVCAPRQLSPRTSYPN